MSHRAGGYGASRTSSRLTGLSGPGGLDYLVLNHLGAAPAGTRVRISQSTRWLMQVLHPLVALAPPSHRTPLSPRSHQALPLGAPTPPFLVLGSAPLALSPQAKALTLPLIRNAVPLLKPRPCLSRPSPLPVWAWIPPPPGDSQSPPPGELPKLRAVDVFGAAKPD